MEMNIYQNYSQFYKGTEPIKSYGNGENKKDTLVKYEFNTTDEKGNKLMDQMTREETLQVMNDIRSQYGDNVIVEFSGDGMAALVEGQKGTIIPQPTEEQQAEKAEKDAAFLNEIVQNEHIEVAEEHITGRIDYNKIMHEKTPETAAQMDSYMHEFGNTKDKTYLQKAAKLALDWFKGNYVRHRDWFETQENSQAAAIKGYEGKLSSRAQKVLDELSRKYGNMDFFVADFESAADARAIMAKSKKDFSVLLTPDELEKMASDEKYKEECMSRIEGAVRMSERINKQFGFTAASKNAPDGGVLARVGISFNKDGSVTYFAELEKASQKQKERIERTREKRAEERKKAEKKEKKEAADNRKIRIEASSEEELIQKIRAVSWGTAAEKDAESGRKFDFSV